MQVRRPSNIEPNRLYLVLKTKRTGSWCCYFAVRMNTLMQMQRSAPSGFQPKALLDWVQHGATWGMEWPLQALQSVQLDRTALFGLTCEAGEKGFHRLGRQPLFYTKQFQQFVQFEQLTKKTVCPTSLHVCKDLSRTKLGGNCLVEGQIFNRDSSTALFSLPSTGMQ